MRRPALALAVALSAVAGLAAPRTGTILIPVEDLLTMRQGTIEFWLQTSIAPAEYAPSTKTYHGLLSLFEIPGATGLLGLDWFAGAMYEPGAGLYVGVRSSKVDLHSIAVGKFMPAPAAWHHLALTWHGTEVHFVLDGSETGQRTNPVELLAAIGAVGQQPLRIGDKWQVRGRFAIDELRLSNVVRRPAELGCHGPLTPDPFTTLLECFDTVVEIDGKTVTKPVLSLTGAACLPSVNCAFVAGRFGQALSLCTPASGDEK